MKGSAITKFIENAVEKIKKLARENTDLFLGIGGWLAPIGAVVIAVIVCCVNWAVYCYEVGYYHFGFNVPIPLIEEPKMASLSTNVIGCILFVVVWVMATLIGRWAYKKCIYFAFVVLELIVISIVTVCPFIPSLVGMDIAEAITTMVIFLVGTIVITLLLNAFSLSYLIVPSTEDKLERKGTELSELEKRINVAASQKTRQKIEKKKNAVQKTIKELEQQTGDKDRAVSSNALKNALAMVVIAVFVLLIVGMPVCLFTGVNKAMQENEVALVMNAKEIDEQFRELLSESCELNGLAIIFENEDGMLVSPCNISNKEVVIYTNFQQFIDAEGLIVYTNTYGSIVPATAELLFDASNDSNVVADGKLG